MLPDEANTINKHLISQEHLCVDYFLSGHIHDAAITNLSNHARSMISLETGIGWPDGLDTTRKDHRYAVYCFDEYKNVFFTQMFKTNRSNEFVIDNDYLFTAHEQETQKIYGPLKTRDHAYIAVNNFDKEHAQYLFVDNSGILMLKSLFSTIRSFSSLCTRLLPNYINESIGLFLKDSPDAINILQTAYNELNVQIDALQKGIGEGLSTTGVIGVFLKDLHSIIDDQSGEQLSGLFVAYLHHVCTSFEQQLSEYFDDRFECRAVFRAYCEDDLYCPICASPTKTVPRSSSVVNTSGFPRSYNFEDSLIKSSFSHKSSLVYSVNTTEHNFAPDNWDDFIVMVPSLENYRDRTARGQFVYYPPLSFVFSVRIKNIATYSNATEQKALLKEMSYKLLLLQFSEVEKIISSVLEDFLKEIPLSISDFVQYCKSNFKGY